MAQKFIQALYETGPEYRDDFVAVPTEMYALVSAAPVLRHITRHSGAVVYVTVYGSAHVSQSKSPFFESWFLMIITSSTAKATST